MLQGQELSYYTMLLLPVMFGQGVDCTVKYIGNSLWTISFLPMCDGMYIISITANGKILLTHKLNIDI